MQVIVMYENRTLRRIKEFKKEKMDHFIGWCMKDPEMKKKLVFIAAANLMINDSMVLASTKTDQMIDRKGLEVYGTIKKIGFWVCLFACCFELIRAAATRADKDDVIKIVMKYAIIMASIFGVYWLFTWFKELFTI